MAEFRNLYEFRGEGRIRLHVNVGRAAVSERGQLRVGGDSCEWEGTAESGRGQL